MSFNKILGQERALRLLQACLSSGRIPSALLFYGPEGVGKTLAARELAKALNCQKIADCRLPIAERESEIENRKSEMDACDLCSSCVQIQKGIHPDVRIVDAFYQAGLLGEPPEKQKSLRVETIRELRRESQRRPFGNGWKLFLVQQAETMTAEASNALLKILEEPSPKTVLILLASDRERLLETVRSRCQAVPFRALAPAFLEQILIQKFPLTQEKAADLAALAEGSAFKASQFLPVLKELDKNDRDDPLAPFLLAELLPRDLAQARNKTENILELSCRQTRTLWRAGKISSRSALERLEQLLGFKRLLRQNVSPASILKLVSLRNE